MQKSAHLNQSSPFTIRSLCEDVKPGKSLYIYRDGTGGLRDEDFVGAFRMWKNAALAA